jgi:hypothetical protein
MNEAEWLECTDPTPMLEFLRGKTSDRKLRLFACACCRKVWHLLTDERSRKAVDVAERYADGVADEDERFNAWDAAYEAGMADEVDAGNAAEAASRSPDQSEFALDTALEAATAVADGSYLAARDAALTNSTTDQDGFYSNQDCDRAADVARAAKEATMNAEAAMQCHLLRDIFGNPFRRITINPAHRSADVLALAHAAYEERELPSGHLDPQRLGVLADALEEAGCGDAGLLDHLRSPGPHVRGCSVVDAIMGKT